MGYRSIPDIISAVEEYYDVRIRTKRKHHSIAVARQVAMYLCRELTHLSLQQIGGMFGRDHTTVLYSLGATARRMEADGRLRAQVQELRDKLSTATVLTNCGREFYSRDSIDRFPSLADFRCTGMVGTGI